MDAIEAAELFDGAIPGTVGEMISRPVPVSVQRRIALGISMLGAIALVLAALITLFDGTISAELGILKAATINLLPAVLPLVIIGITFLVAGIIIYAVQLVRHEPKYDRHAATKRALYALLLTLPRFAVTRRTPTRDVGLRERPVFGVTDAAAYSVRGEFLPDDFRGKRPSEFSAFDFEVIEGSLYVFYSSKAKQDFAARIQRRNQ